MENIGHFPEWKVLSTKTQNKLKEERDSKSFESLFYEIKYKFQVLVFDENITTNHHQTILTVFD